MSWLRNYRGELATDDGGGQDPVLRCNISCRRTRAAGVPTDCGGGSKQSDLEISEAVRAVFTSGIQSLCPILLCLPGFSGPLGDKWLMLVAGILASRMITP